MRTPAPLRVVANPFRVLDADGEPTCAVRRPDIGRFIGATLDRSRSAFDDDKNPNAHSLKFLFTDQPETVANTIEYRRLVQDGHILAFDEPTARLCGMKFVPVAEASAAHKAAAIDAHQAEHGEPPPWALPMPAAAPSAPAPRPTAPSKESAS